MLADSEDLCLREAAWVCEHCVMAKVIAMMMVMAMAMAMAMVKVTVIACDGARRMENAIETSRSSFGCYVVKITSPKAFV